jgi:hypothetical protein
MESPIPPLLFSVLLFIGMLILVEVGRRIARRRLKESDDDKGSMGTIEGAIFALFGLMIAFTFSGAASRFNEKRMLIAEEANRIEVAYLRLQLVPEQAQHQLQELFRRYTDSRLEIYRRLPDMRAAEQEMGKSKELQKEIWRDSIATSRDPKAHPDAGKLLLPAVNAMIDISTIRRIALQNHPPNVVYWLLFVLGLLCSLLAGYRMAGSQRRSWLHTFAFAFITVTIVYVILDLEFPRIGLFRLVNADQAIVDVLHDMH